MSRTALHVLDDPDGVAATAADLFVDTAEQAIAARGRAVVVLAGGSTPRKLYTRLSEPPHRGSAIWRDIEVLFGDERQVGPDDAASNYRMARETLLSGVPIPAERVHRMRGEVDLERAAAEYERTLRSLFAAEGRARFDLLLLGMGDDGHTASLFPGTDALAERERWVVANRVPQLETRRLTLTLPALCSARHVLFLITGAAKARRVAEVFGGAPHPAPHPAERVVPEDGLLTILLDRAAASDLPPRT